MSGRKKSSKTPLLIVALVLVILILVILCAVYFGLRYFYGRSSYLKDSDVAILYDLLDGTYADNAEQATAESAQNVVNNDTNATAGSSVAAATNDVQMVVQDVANDSADIFDTLDEDGVSAVEQAASEAENISVATEASVYNLLLVGVDTRGAGYGNSDSMILLSINSSTGTAYLTSFMRDLYSNIPGVGVRKLNAAYAVGGGPLLVSTISSNYRININNYAAVNFAQMSNIIDLLGGVDIEVSTDEAGYMNGYISEQCGLQGLDPSAYYVSGGGVIHMNGIQAVAFSRIRYIARGSENFDYGRTSRQREVLTNLLNKARSLDAASLLGFVNSALPNITHNIDEGTLISLLSNAASYINYNLVTQRVPFDGMYSYSGEEIVPDFEATATKLYNTIYLNQQ